MATLVVAGAAALGGYTLYKSQKKVTKDSTKIAQMTTEANQYADLLKGFQEREQSIHNGVTLPVNTIKQLNEWKRAAQPDVYGPARMSKMHRTNPYWTTEERDGNLNRHPS